ncbi:MAG: DMT family transporter [Sedimenticola sp.]
MEQIDKDKMRGVQLMLLGCIILPLMDASVKYMGETIASGIIVLARFFFQSLFLLPLVWKKRYLPRGGELALHLKRSFWMTLATLSFFTAIQVMPIADALAIFFVMPLLVTLLAPWILDETVGWHRLTAVAVGLVGAIIIIQPGHELFGPRAFLPLLTALGFSFYLMYTRKLARSDESGGVPAITMQFYSGLFGAVLTSIVILLFQPLNLPMFRLAWPQPWQWQLLVLVGFLAAVGHLVITTAFRHADASILAPFQYSELIVAALLGWWLFDDVPAVTTWVGALILVSSGLYIFHRERA